MTRPLRLALWWCLLPCPAYATTVRGTLTVYDNGIAATVPVHGTGDRRDCGRHSFRKDSGETITVVIDCDRSR